MITSKRHPGRFYAAIIFMFFLYLFLSFLLIYLSTKTIDRGQETTQTLFMLLAGFGVLYLAFYTVVRYYKNAPNITVDDYNITFGNKKYNLTDITSLNLTGKKPFPYILYFSKEAATIKFKDGTVKYIFDDMYKNTWQIKSFLKKTCIDKPKGIKNVPKNKFDKNQLQFEKITLFKGSQWTSFTGLILWSLIIFLLIMSFFGLNEPNVGFSVFAGGLILFWFYLNSRLLYYFGTTHKLFIVKNHNLFWEQHIYAFTDIKVVVFERNPKQPNSLRITTNDFKNKLFPAGSLRDHTWIALKKQLEKNGVTVINNNIFIKKNN